MKSLKPFLLALSSPLLFGELSSLEAVDPTIGNVSPFLKPTYPTFQLPNEMLRVFPIQQDYRSDIVEAFPLQVVSHRKPGFIRLRASSSGRLLEPDYQMAIDHDLQTIKPWHYQTHLIEEDLKVDFVPGSKSGLYKFTFPEGAARQLSLHGSPEITFTPGANASFVVKESFTFVRERNEWMTPVTMPIWAYCVLTSAEGAALPELTLSQRGGTFLIEGDQKGAREIQLRYAISYLSPEKAKEHFEKELNTQTFGALVAHAKEQWQEALDHIQVAGGTEAQRRTFYTAFYRTFERMIDVNEGGEYFSGYSQQVEQYDRPMFVDDWVWDSYRTHHPLRLLLKPSQQIEMLRSYIEMCRLNGGKMPTFPQVYGNSPCMNSFHSSSLFLDAHRKGLTGFDLEAAYAGVKKNMTKGTWIPWRQGAERTALDDQTEALGYVPALYIGEEETEPVVDSFERRQAVAVTLGRSYDGWVMRELSEILGKTDQIPYFDQISRDYRKLWKPEVKLFMPKDAEGNWVPINPKLDGGPGFRDYYDENNGWVYAWGVPHNIPDLIALHGGPEATVASLDQLFREPLGTQRHVFHAIGPDSTGMVGQFSMGNEPSFHIPFLYNYCGVPWKTQQRVRFLLDVWFKDNIFGIPGDEDGGTMSAWVVWASIGLYPTTPGTTEYTICSPLFTKTTLPLENGNTFVISAPQASKRNKYIQSATLNGTPLEKPFIDHQDIVKGGELFLTLGEKPNHKWGAKF